MDDLRLIHAIPQVDAEEVIGNWMTDQWNVSQTRKYLHPGAGYIEAASMLTGSKDLKWDNVMLRQALTTMRPLDQNLITSSPTGVSLRRGADDLGWGLLPEDRSINPSGMIYTSGLLREDFEPISGVSSSLGIPTKYLRFTLALNRIAGELLNRYRLYKLLGVGDGEPWHFFITHGGLMGRTLFADPSEFLWLAFERLLCSEDTPHEWQEELTQGQVRSEIVNLTYTISRSLFEKFGLNDFPEGRVEKVLSDSGLSSEAFLSIS